MLRLVFQRMSYNRKADRTVFLSRSEAKTVPNLLVAPISPTVQPKKNDLYSDYPQGYYSNGAYTATPFPLSKATQTFTNGGQQEDQDPQDAYYASLCARFTVLTKTLQSTPPHASPNNTDVYYFDWTTRRIWRGKILNTAPTMAVLVRLTQESVIWGLDVLESLLTLANIRGKRGKYVKAWTWGLLGKCREVGQMGSEEVGVVRNLGKRAVWLIRRIRAGDGTRGTTDELDANMEEEEGEEEEDGDGELEEEFRQDGPDPADLDDADDGHSSYIDPITTADLGNNDTREANPTATTTDADLEKAKQHILNSLGTNQTQTDSAETNASKDDSTESPVPKHADTGLKIELERGLKERSDDKADLLATLDILVTIIGEFYGQRDLLEGRLLWDEMQ